MDIAGLFVASVSALGSLIQAFYTARDSNKKVDNRKVRLLQKRAKKPLKVGIKTIDAIIDDKLLAALSSNIEKHNKILIDAFTNNQLSDAEKAVKVEEARIQICKTLSEIKKFNNDQLPTKRLEQLWLSNQC